MLFVYTLAMLGIGLTLLMTPVINRNFSGKFVFLMLLVSMLPVFSGVSALLVYNSAPIWGSKLEKKIANSTIYTPVNLYNVPPDSLFRFLPSSLKFGEKEQQAFRNFFLREDVHKKFSNCSDPLVNFFENFDMESYQAFSLCVHEKNKERKKSNKETKHQEELRQKAQQERLIDLYKGIENAE